MVVLQLQRRYQLFNLEFPVQEWPAGILSRKAALAPEAARTRAPFIFSVDQH